MDLRKTKLDTLLDDLDTSTRAVGWNDEWTQKLYAELKRRCEASELPSMWWWDALEKQAEAANWGQHLVKRLRKHFYYPVCPCPVVREREWLGMATCPKCGAQYNRGPGVAADGPCCHCLASKPDAPTGYVHVGEWRLVEQGEYFLAETGGTARAWCCAAMVPSGKLDGGKRWILRKKAECPPLSRCPKCGKEWPWHVVDGGKPCPECLESRADVPTCDKCGGPAKPASIKESTWHITPGGANICWHCYYTRPTAPQGHEYTGEWGPPKKGEWYEFRGKAQHADQDHSDGDGPRWILRKKAEDCPVCPKCGKDRPWPTEVFPTAGQAQMWFEAATTRPCPDCQIARPTAPQGHEFTGDWGNPRGEQYDGQHFLTILGEAWPCHRGIVLDESIDQGRRWILRKKAEESHHTCPKCRDSYVRSPVAEPGSRICLECISARPTAPAGFKHVGEWRPPEEGEMYLSICGTIACGPRGEIPIRGRVNCRWILKKVGQRGEVLIMDEEYYPRWSVIESLTRRVEELEKKA